MVRPFIFAIFVFTCTYHISAQKELGQQPIATKSDTISLSEERAEPDAKAERQSKRKAARALKKSRFKANWALPYPNPHRAGIYSLILPSAGQIYNKRYWKAPFVWGGFAALIYSLDYNKSNFNKLNSAYGASLKGLSHEYEQFTSEALKSRRDYHNKNLQLTYVGFVAMYALAALDAYVDAHLKNFDISDDLSFNITTIRRGGIESSVSPGVGLVLKL